MTSKWTNMRHTVSLQFMNYVFHFTAVAEYWPQLILMADIVHKVIP